MAGAIARTCHAANVGLSRRANQPAKYRYDGGMAILSSIRLGDGPAHAVLLHGFLGSGRNLRGLAQRWPPDADLASAESRAVGAG